MSSRARARELQDATTAEVPPCVSTGMNTTIAVRFYAFSHLIRDVHAMENDLIVEEIWDGDTMSMAIS